MKSKKFQNASLAELYSRYGILLILVVALIAGAILSPAFLVPSNLISVAKNVGVYAIMALGMTRLLIGGGVDLSAGSNVAMCSVVAAVVFNSTENSLLALVAAIIVGALGADGLQTVAEGAPVFGAGDTFVFLAQGNVLGIPMILVVVLAATAVMAFVMSRTSHGRYLYAIGGNAEAAGASGINVKRQLFINYVVMGAICGLAGVIYAGRTNSGLPAGGVNFEFEAIIGCVLGGTSMAGGIGNVVCSIIGVFVVGIINNVMNLCSVNAFWQQVVKGIVILVAVLLDVFTRNAIMKSTKKR